ncbi:MAG: hypothetical protein OHK0013_19940 [Sandaracinaceae bacterium]
MRSFGIAAVLLVACASSACVTVRSRTEAVVDIDAEDAIRGDIEALLVTVRGGPAMGELDTMLTEVVPTPTYPARVTILPRGEDATRRYEVIVLARARGGNVVGRQSVRGRFLAGQTVRTTLLLEACCADVAARCGPDETCTSCECQPTIVIDPEQDAGMPPDDAALDAGSRPDVPPDAPPPACTRPEDCPPRPCESPQCVASTCIYTPLCGAGQTCCRNECADNCDCLDRRRGDVCRPSSGACDAAEVCDGMRPVCPPDVVLPAGSECRPAASACDVAETCDGFSRACPADAFQAFGVTCASGTCDGRGACVSGCTPGGSCPLANPCEAGEITCPGGMPTCTPTGRPSGADVVCRPESGPCDTPERCTATSTTCPLDAFLDARTTCRPSAGPCDVAETCSGSTAACPPDVRSPAGMLCRTADGACDVPETCDGTSPICPEDRFVVAGTACDLALGPCQAPPMCTGTSPACPSSGTPLPDGTPCNDARCGSSCQGGACLPNCFGREFCCVATGSCELFPWECPEG